MKYIKQYIVFFLLIFLSSCTSEKSFVISIKNHSENIRETTSVVIPLSEINSRTSKEFSSIGFKNVNSGKIYSSQLVDENSDGENESVLFQPTVGANAEEKFEVVFSSEGCDEKKSTAVTYSRFVPERIDDYAWENDRVAFRAFGPKAQLLFEEDRMEGKDKGTISSGIDCWFKRVDYSVIDSWYKKYTENTGTYHEDTGEGLDSYHVGKSRGCGGIGVWDTLNKKLIVSKNFTTWKTIDKGPIRTRFQLDYAPWKAGGDLIKERKTISLDLGDHLSKYEVNFSGLDAVKEIVVGLTLHDKSGFININEKEGWFRYWETIKGDEVGTGIVVDPKYIVKHKKYIVEEKDESHIFIHLKPIDGKIVYYTGYGWKKGKYFSSKEDWDAYLSVFSKNLQTPLVVKFD